MKENPKDKNRFQKKKIISLNKFFMHQISLNGLFILIIYIISFIFLFLLTQGIVIDEQLKISLISMSTTFILTTSKTIIEKLIAIIQFIISQLGAEQRGLNKNIGIEMDKVEFDSEENEIDEPKIIHYIYLSPIILIYS